MIDVKIDGSISTSGSTTIDVARPSTLWRFGRLPAKATISLVNSNPGAQLEAVMKHEIGHALGIGSLWSAFGLVSGAGGSNPVYTGLHGMDGYGGAPVPVEDTGGAGRRDVHWRESVFDREVMTPDIDPDVPGSPGTPITLITKGALLDLGYEIY